MADENILHTLDRISCRAHYLSTSDIKKKKKIASLTPLQRKSHLVQASPIERASDFGCSPELKGII